LAVGEEGEEEDHVPNELRGREVTVRAVLPPWEAARKKGASPNDLTKGTSYSIAHWQDSSERIAWEDFARFLSNVGSVLNDEELEAVGGDALRSPLLRALVLPGRLLFPLAEVYRWGAAPNGPAAQTFLAQKTRVRQLSDDVIEIDARVKRGYTNAREHWLITKGLLSRLGLVFGTAPSTVGMLEHVDGNGVRYEVVLPRRPKKRFVLVDAVRRGTSWLSAAKETAVSLHEANEELTTRYADLHREVLARRKAEAELRVLNEALERRVAERTAELEAANEELAAANRELSMFSTSAAHDLRSPLRAINGFATALLEDHGDALADEAKAQLHRVIEGAVRMATLIDALLALSRVTRLDVKRERVDLAEIAHSILDRLHALEPTRIVERDITPSPLIAWGDAGLLRVLLENLLGNAWKFTRNRPRARIELTRIDIDTYRVRDNGVGFDLAHADLLFEPFRRLHREEEFPGTGIGLATALRVVRRHGGRIWAEATVGEGAWFSFTLGGGSS
jgi:signal transduction histidine kinase